MKFNLIFLSLFTSGVILLQVTGEGRKRNQISVGSCSEVTFPGKISDADLRSLNASIQVRDEDDNVEVDLIIQIWNLI